MAPPPPALLASWAAHGAVAASYLLFRATYAADPATYVHAPSNLLSLGVLPDNATQEVDLLLFTLILAAQKWRRSSNDYEFIGTLIFYLQLSVGALLTLTATRPAVAYGALLLAAWLLLPPLPLPLRRMGFAPLTPYEAAVLASQRAKAAGSFGGAGVQAGGKAPASGERRDRALVLATGSRGGDEAAFSVRDAMRGPKAPACAGRTQLWHADVLAYPELAGSLGVDVSLMSLELPSVLLVKPDGSGKPSRRLPLKSEPDEEGHARVQTVKLSAANLRRYFGDD